MKFQGFNSSAGNIRMRLISAFLSLAMVFSLTSLAAYADDDPPPIKDTYVVDGITYYNVNSPNINSERKFYEDMVKTKHSSLGGYSLAQLWMMITAGLAETQNSDNDDWADIMRTAITTGQYSKKNYEYEFLEPEWDNDENAVVTKVKVTWVVPVYGAKYPTTITVRFKDFKVAAAMLDDDKEHYISSTIEYGPDKPSIEPSDDAALINNSAADGVTLTKELWNA